MGLVAAFVNNPVKVAVGVLLTLLFGTIALITLPIQLVPEVRRPVISLETIWPWRSNRHSSRDSSFIGSRISASSTKARRAARS